MLKLTKKGRNLGAVDSWLETLDFYRKNVAYDETCLFRAVSEQIYNCQVHHEKVRKECIAYGRENFGEFACLVKTKEKWVQHLLDLEKHMLFCGNIEIQIISQKYNRDVIIFDGNKQQIFNATQRNCEEKLFLCLMEEDHYDVVYKKDYIENAGFCQSLVYKIFYERAFNVSNVDSIVRNMLHEKQNLLDMVSTNKIKEGGKTCPEDENYELSETGEAGVKSLLAPFPFKVAKALDANIYRNIEYDAWVETRRELRLGDWYYGDEKLILGTKCVYSDEQNHEQFECYLQEILQGKNQCVIYLTKTAQKRTVPYAHLSPENDAKPWPLPYRFSKGLTIQNQPQVEKIYQKPRKRKDKKRTKSESNANANTSESLDNVDAYVGVPLRMQSPNSTNYHCQQSEVSPESQTNPPVEEPEVTVEHTSRYAAWESSGHAWPQYLPSTPEPFNWPLPAMAPPHFNFGVKPMIASAPVTPDTVPYHDPNYPFFFNYHVDPVAVYNHQWSVPPPATEVPVSSPEETKSAENPPACQAEHQPERAHVRSPPRIKTEICTEHHYQQPQQTVVVSQPCTRPKLYVPLTPQQSPPVEIFSPVMPMSPGAPVTQMMYAPPQTQELQEMMLQTPPVMYTPQIEVQYMSPFIYPPTPPAAWYPQGVNTHGFIFPRPN